uniref:Sulfotransferase n=1 Tax=Neolamprologus brichardi TaxID=32507 RepID=A0A3Q4I115_NEOBR
MELPPRPQLFDFNGVSMTNVFTDNWDNVQNFKARPDDILIATYPKAGTDLYIRVWSLCNHSIFLCVCVHKQFCIDVRVRTPHFSVVYVARNAKDNAVSYFHFDRMNLIQPEPGDWSSYLQGFMEGKSEFSVVLKFRKHKRQEIDRLCSFLGLSPSPEEKERVRASVTFDSMKQNKMTNYTTIPELNHKVSPFMRKGKVGDWKNHFTVAQNERFDEDYKKKMKNPDLKFRFEI